MATLYLDIEKLILERSDAAALVEKLKAVLVEDHPKATVEINGDSEFDNEPEDEDAEVDEDEGS